MLSILLCLSDAILPKTDSDFLTSCHRPWPDVSPPHPSLTPDPVPSCQASSKLPWAPGSSPWTRPPLHHPHQGPDPAVGPAPRLLLQQPSHKDPGLRRDAGSGSECPGLVLPRPFLHKDQSSISRVLKAIF